MTETPMLEIRAVTKRYGETVALRDLSLDVTRGEFVSLLGPSGCGKTTLLRMIAGFAEPDGGDIRIDGRPQARVPTNRRNLGLVFQNYSLWPHMTIADNVGFGLDCRGIRGARRRARIAECLDLVRLTDMGGRLPRELSGGQQQRVALARALAYEPAVLLLDEPLSALDRRLREELRGELRRIHGALGITTILVTHDQDEALSLSDRIAVMRQGRIEQVGSPEAIYRVPATDFVADFLGQANILSGRLDDAAARLVLPGGAAIPVPAGDDRPGAAVRVVVRPEHVALSPAPGGDAVRGRVLDRTFLGSRALVRLELAGGDALLAEVPAAEAGFGVGETVAVAIDPAAMVPIERSA